MIKMHTPALKFNDLREGVCISVKGQLQKDVLRYLSMILLRTEVPVPFVPRRLLMGIMDLQ